MTTALDIPEPQKSGFEGLGIVQRELNAIALNNESRTGYTLDIKSLVESLLGREDRTMCRANKLINN